MNNTRTNKVENIDKERIGSLHFKSMDELMDEKDKLQRAIDLKIAEKLGNTHKGKAKIYFNSEEGEFRVETTVWAATEKYIALKGGVLIPIRSISRVLLA